MLRGLVQFDWNDVENYTSDEITYFLSLEGKSINSICKIRNLSKEEVQRQLIEGKIKYRFLAKSKNVKELFLTLCDTAKQDKLLVLNSLSNESREKLIEHIKVNYAEMPSKNKETAVWILGELNAASGIDILQKATVHNHVNIRRMAVSAMGKITDKGSETALIRALDDENSQVVLYAIKSLIKLKSEKAMKKISLIYNCTEIEYLKRAAEEYIACFIK